METPLEDYVVLTQSTLGRFVHKPRLTPERLRKPPFRFLFDLFAEVSRQTGFGLDEVFGDLCEKPKLPTSREEKIAFMNRWLAVTARQVEHSELAEVSALNVVCGLEPQWTNYLLQCTAAAAWPGSCAQSTSEEESDRTNAEINSNGDTANYDLRQKSVKEHVPETGEEVHMQSEDLGESGDVGVKSLLAEVERTDTETKFPALLDVHTDAVADCEGEPADEVYAELAHASLVSGGVSPLSQRAPSPEILPAPTQPECCLEFDATLNKFDALQQACERTGILKPRTDMGPKADDMVSSSTVVGSVRELPEGHKLLRTAALKNEKVTGGIAVAQNLIENIERALEEKEVHATAMRTARAKRLVVAEGARQRCEAEAAARAEQKAAAHKIQAEEEDAAMVEERAARKAKHDAKLARKEEKEAQQMKAEKLAKMKFPTSKLAATHEASGPRIVSCIGDEDYADDFEPDDSSEVLSSVYVSEVGENLGMSASIFDSLKSQLKETFVPYLCNSMPTSLLRQYNDRELVRCLQQLLRELRRCLTHHKLDDLSSEEHTSMAEELREQFPDDWLHHLQDASPSALCEKYNIVDLLDTLQSLGQLAVERLTENFGPITVWASPTSPLRCVPPAQIPAPSDATGRKGVKHRSLCAGTGSDGVEERASPTGLRHGSQAGARNHNLNMVQTASIQLGSTLARDRVTRSPRKLREPAVREPVNHYAFDSTLGPALWEQDAPLHTTLRSEASLLRQGTSRAPRFQGTSFGRRF